MKNNELFKSIFGIYAEEFWAFPEEKMLNWLGCEVSTQNNDSNALKALDCVSRQAAIDALGFYKPLSDTWTDEYEIGVYKQWQKDKKAISELPTAQPKKGRWKICNILDYAQRPTGRKIGKCPFCNYLTDDFKNRVDYYKKMTNFCPNCGADMRGDEDEAN